MSEKIYEPGDEDIIALKKQINISEEDAINLLLKHGGDLVECVLDSYGFQEQKKKEEKTKTNEQEVFTDLRKIVNEKNKVYSENIVGKSNNQDFNQDFKQVNNTEIKVI